MTQVNAPKLLVVELNEVSPLLIEQAAAEMPLPNLQRLLALSRAETTTEDAVEHQGLDPWVQWVGVHTGQPTSEHGVRRLGLTSGQTDRQIWQDLGRRGHRWGVWGAMNAPQGTAPGCGFFMPDPWSFEERAFPEPLNDLLALPRYSATNYLEIDRKAALAAVLRLVRYFLPPTRWATVMRTIGALGKSLGQPGPNVHTFSTLFDYVSVLVFGELRRRQRPDFSLIFLNHIAHLQHQFWARGSLDANMRFGLRMSDVMIGQLLDARQPGEAILVANGMRQKNVAGDGFHVYRQTQPQRAIDRLGVTAGRVEQCMTHDAHILFTDPGDADAAMRILAACTLPDGEPVFYVERVNPTKIFYQLDFDHEVPAGTIVRGPSGTVPFDQLFELVCARTGAHEQRGDVFFDGIEVPARLANHELFDVMLRHFDVGAPMLAAAA